MEKKEKRRKVVKMRRKQPVIWVPRISVGRLDVEIVSFGNGLIVHRFDPKLFCILT